MEERLKRFRRPIAAILAAVLLLPAVSAGAKTRGDVTANNNDGLGRLFGEKPEYCLLCGELHTGAGGAFVRFFHDVGYFFCGLFGAFPSQGRMYFTKEVVDAGADEPFYFVHMSDTHLTDANEKDLADPQLAQTVARREGFCATAVRMLDDGAVKARELDAFIVHTGDLIDFVSRANLARAKAFTAENDVFASAGNHEYSRYIWGDPEDEAQRDSVRDRLQASFTNNLEYSVRVEHGVKFITVDNAYYRIKQWQLDAFRASLAEDDLPVILCVHVPLYAPDIHAHVREVFGEPAWLMNVPEELMEGWEDGWIEHQRSDAVTAEFYDLVVSTPRIKAIFTGHEHFDFVSQLTPTLKQYVTDCTQGRIVEVR